MGGPLQYTGFLGGFLLQLLQLIVVSIFLSQVLCNYVDILRNPFILLKAVSIEE